MVIIQSGMGVPLATGSPIFSQKISTPSFWNSWAFFTISRNSLARSPRPAWRIGRLLGISLPPPPQLARKPRITPPEPPPPDQPNPLQVNRRPVDRAQIRAAEV